MSLQQLQQSYPWRNLQSIQISKGTTFSVWLVHFHDLLKKHPEAVLVNSLPTREVYHAAVGLIDCCLPDMETELIYTKLADKRSYTLLVFRERSEAEMELAMRLQARWRKKEKEKQDTTKAEASATEQKEPRQKDYSSKKFEDEEDETGEQYTFYFLIFTITLWLLIKAALSNKSSYYNLTEEGEIIFLANFYFSFYFHFYLYFDFHFYHFIDSCWIAVFFI